LKEIKADEQNPEEQKGGANNNTNDNANAIANNLLANSNTIANVGTNVNNATPNLLIDKFKQFIDEYAKIDKIDSNVLEIVNTAFKTHQDFSKEISTEAALRISDEDFEEFCINNINDKSMITLSLDDPRLGEFVKIYKDLKTVYLDNCEYLLTLLEKNILDKEKVSEKNDNPRFALKNIGFSDLSSFETDVRNRLVSMYSQCQEHYQKGIMALYTALKTPAE
jgi:hypothetical protein